MPRENQASTPFTDTDIMSTLETSPRPLLATTLLGPALHQLSRSMRNVTDKFVKLKDLDIALVDFNSSFGSFLFGMQANDETVEWKHTPTEQLAKQYHSQKQTRNVPENSTPHTNTTVEKPTTITTSTSTERANKLKRKKQAPQNQPPPKKRNMASKSQIDKIISSLPEHFRGRTAENEVMKKVIEALISHPEGLSRKDLVNTTSIAQPKVIDCLKALSRSKAIKSKKIPGQYDSFYLA
ncbi:hypothetical protein BY458DRAFT_517711 [Sporodiniella umbellata]|nr:hypothetical protein BY458DRAFT_517711 [Sporodiniella umbellata]